MATKTKTPEKKAFVPFGALARLTELIPAFKVQSYNDIQRIDKLMKLLGGGMQEYGLRMQEIFKSHNLAEGESVDMMHPLYDVVNADFRRFQQAESTVERAKLACMTQKELMEAATSIGLNYADIKTLTFYLVKD